MEQPWNDCESLEYISKRALYNQLCKQLRNCVIKTWYTDYGTIRVDITTDVFDFHYKMDNCVARLRGGMPVEYITTDVIHQFKRAIKKHFFD